MQKKEGAMASEVQVIESSFVAPSAAMPRKGLWVSSLDLERANRGYTPTVYLYRSTDATAAAGSVFDVTSRLKESMAKALVLFYPLAGRLGVDNDGRVEINCNSEGALFVVARSELTMDDLMKDLEPSLELRRLFVPSIEEEPPSIILAVQVTFFKCGGISLGTALHHVAVDGASAFHFFQTWSAISRDGDDGAAVELPCHDRTLLRARSPPTVHPDALSVLCPKMNLITETTSSSGGPTASASASKVLIISADQLTSLKRLCGSETTFCAVSALVWQCMCVARRLPPAAETRVSFSVNIRRCTRPPLPSRYFGNALVAVYAAAAAGDIASEALESVAGRIRGAISQVDDELVRSAVDYLELSSEIESPLPTGKVLPQTELRMISWLGMPLYDADFGWGKPWRMSRAQPSSAGVVLLMNDGQDDPDSGVRVLVGLEAAHMEEFQRLLYAKL